MKNSDKKTNEKVSLKWPSSTYFGFGDVIKANPKYNIIVTLRSHFDKARDNGKIAEIGVKPGGHGRPPKMYAFTPLTPTVVNKAKSNKITLTDEVAKTFNIVDVIPPPAASEINHSPAME